MSCPSDRVVGGVPSALPTNHDKLTFQLKFMPSSVLEADLARSHCRFRRNFGPRLCADRRSRAKPSPGPMENWTCDQHRAAAISYNSFQESRTFVIMSWELPPMQYIYLNQPKPTFCRVPIDSILRFIIRTYKRVGFGSLRYIMHIIQLVLSGGSTQIMSVIRRRQMPMRLGAVLQGRPCRKTTHAKEKPAYIGVAASTNSIAMWEFVKVGSLSWVLIISLI